jgi:hypothetical protein
MPLLVLLVLSVAFRLPALLNAGSVDSDSAIVGLQAMHILHGEWSPFLLGSGYQTSVDSFVAALFFAVLGPTPFALMLSTFAGHLALMGLAFATLRRHVAPWTAVLLCLPLVFTPAPLHTYILGPPRQAALTLVFVAVWLIDGASHARSALAWYAGGTAIAWLACYADPYALLFLPALLLLALLACRDDVRGKVTSRETVLRRLAACTAGGVIGVLPLVWLWRRPDAAHGEVTLTAAVLRHNWDLLRDACLPWILSMTAYTSRRGVGYVPWPAPGPFHLLQIAGALLFVAGVIYGAVAFVRGRLPWRVRRLGLVGFVMLPLTLAGFLLSVMVMDLFSTRYLAAIVLMSPLALAPAACALGDRSFAALLTPYVSSAAVAGWLGFGAFVDGALPVRTARGQGADELRVREVLLDRGITRAVADYWVAYRMTFLAREALVVVPIHAAEDRYPPYRDAFDGARDVAYVFDAQRSRESLTAEERELASGTSGFEAEDRVLIVIGDLTAVVLRRTTPRQTSASKARPDSARAL